MNHELIIDAFKRGLLRRDLREELGRLKPKTLGSLMELVNDWADGEDSVQRPRGDALDDDDDPKNSRFRRKRKNQDMERFFVNSNQVAATYQRRDGGNRDPGTSQSWRYLPASDARGPRPRRDWQPEKDDTVAGAMRNP